VGAVVATIGTTGTGSLDPLPEIVELKNKYGFRIHADAAYGGYFTLLDDLPQSSRRIFDALPMADSIVIDPHKHGLQPYGCGCILFKDPSVGKFYKHDSPYTYFSSNELHLGEISLECSRPGAAAAALWATQQLLPMEPEGRFARDLAKCREAAVDLAGRISEDSRFRLLMEPETDIVTWAPLAETDTEISRLSRSIFETAAENDLHLAAFTYPTRLLKNMWKDVRFEGDQMTCLRSCLMKPEHKDRMDEIWNILDKSTKESH
jgi:glutamate/tyrosine decarboxylase-like PLP-dependent enzyme